MSIEKLHCRQEEISLPDGKAIGCSYRWPGGQYCVIHTDCGLVGCGIYDCQIATKFGMAIAICRGTPEHPLCHPEDLLDAQVAEISGPAAQLGIQIGMLGREALSLMLKR